MSQQKKSKRITHEQFIRRLNRLRESKTLSEIGEMMGGIGASHVRQILLGYVTPSDKVLASCTPPLRRIVYYEEIESDPRKDRS